MSLASLAKNGRIVETVENYPVNADTNPLAGDTNGGGGHFIESDEHFWESFMRQPEECWNKPFSFYRVTVSNWVARVPGLYWAKNSERYRNPPDSEVEFRSHIWKTYSPQGKSSIVMGGIGDFVLPPDDNGKSIMTISTSNNASTGIPVLIHQEILDHYQIKQGDLLDINSAYWRKMSLEWSSRFQSFDEIKRGYLVIDNPSQIHVVSHDQPVEFHPCTIMEYNSDNAILYDFVFCTADTRFDNYRKQIENFFEGYKNKNGRFGKYLLAADSTDPLFESTYYTPLDLKRAEPDGRSQLMLITERIQNTFYHKGETIDTLLEKIPKHYPGSKEILALAIQIGIPESEIHSTAAARMSTQLVEICIRRTILETLVDRILMDNPELIHQ